MRLSQSDLEIIQQVKIFLENEYRCQHTHELLAKRFHANETKLRKGFRFVYKIAIYEYQVSFRIERAKKFLADTDETVKCIDPQVGYDTKSLEKQFKKLTGFSPLEWRKACSSYTMSSVI